MALNKNNKCNFNSFLHFITFLLFLSQPIENKLNLPENYPPPDIEVCSPIGVYSFNPKTLTHKCSFSLKGAPTTGVTKVCLLPPGYKRHVWMGFKLTKENEFYCPDSPHSGWYLSAGICWLRPFWEPRKGIKIVMDCDQRGYNEIGYHWVGHTKDRSKEAVGLKGSCDGICDSPSDPELDEKRGCTCHSKMNETNCADWYVSCYYYIKTKGEFKSLNRGKSFKIENGHFIKIILGVFLFVVLFNVIGSVKLSITTFLCIDDFMRERVCCCCKRKFFNYRESSGIKKEE